jgi:parvulin-like peptidyl-prolyl isomerase
MGPHALRLRPGMSRATALRLLPALALAGSCHEPSPAPSDPVILALDDQQVRRSDFEQHLEALEEKGGAKLGVDVREALLEPYLEERVLVLEARARGLLRDDGTPEDERDAVQALIEEAVSEVRVSDEEIQGYYAENSAGLRVPENVALRQILVPTLNQARDVQRRLRKDRKSFEALARSLSRGPEAASGGQMGVFSRGELPPELEAAAFSLAVGATSPVIETPLGYHILRVDAREPAREPTLEECRDQIRSILYRRRHDQRVRQFVRALMTRAKVNREAAKAPSRRS